ncbi:MAG: hypothetical protein K0Q54_3095 [Methylobacterium brachiatum]|jgi:hypothetical protein|nr:hypothetical protein [Methylobacterium brachiatum]
MHPARTAAVLVLAAGLTGCGAYVPDLTGVGENPKEEAAKVGNLIAHVQCEVKYAVQSIIATDYDTADLRAQLAKTTPYIKPTGRAIEWFDGFAAQITLTLTVEDTGSLNAGLGLTDPWPNALTNYNTATKSYVQTAQSGTVSLSAQYSNKATRKETLSLFVDFKQFAGRPQIEAFRRLRSENRTGNTCSQPGTPFMQGDLKLKEWLEDALLLANGDDNYGRSLAGSEVVTKKDVIQHQVTFTITTSGGATPGWRLLRISANQGNLPFLNAQRVNTQDVIVTIGPKLDDKTNPLALNSILSAQIRQAN